MNKWREIVDDTIQVVERMKRSGVTHVVVSPETLADLGRPPVRRASQPGIVAENDSVAGALSALCQQAGKCVKCSQLAPGRHHVVFGVGDPHAELMFVGEAPGYDEDKVGEPFVGRAGQLLTKMIQAMGYKRSEVYIANVVKCRPPNNRQPQPDEMENCLPFLRQQIALIHPKVIVALGATATRGLFAIETPIGRLRGQWRLFENIPTMPTFHPAYLLRNPAAKREVWQDLQAVMARLGR